MNPLVMMKFCPCFFVLSDSCVPYLPWVTLIINKTIITDSFTMLAAVRKFVRTCFPKCCTVREAVGEPSDATAGLEMTEREPSADKTGSGVNTQLTTDTVATPSDNLDTSVTNDENDDNTGDDGLNATLESGGATGHPSPCSSEDSATMVDDFFDTGPFMGPEVDEEGYHSDEGGNGNVSLEFIGGARADAVTENTELEDDVEEKVTMTSQRDLGGFQQE